MLHVLYNGLDSAGRELLTCGDTLEPRELFKSIMDEENRGTLSKCASIVVADSEIQ